MTTDAATEAIRFALEPSTDEPVEFLRAWFQGDFDVIRREWPDAPESVFVGADPTVTPELLQATENEIKRDAGAAVPCNSLLIAAATWRSAEIAAAAIRLGMHVGDKDAADFAELIALNDLRTETDRVVNANQERGPNAESAE